MFSITQSAGRRASPISIENQGEGNHEVTPLKPRISLFGSVHSLSELLDDIDRVQRLSIAEFIAELIFNGVRRNRGGGRTRKA